MHSKTLLHKCELRKILVVLKRLVAGFRRRGLLNSKQEY